QTLTPLMLQHTSARDPYLLSLRAKGVITITPMLIPKTQLLSLNISLTVFIMIWQVLARKKDGEEVRVPATTLSEARGAACCFIRDGLDVEPPANWWTPLLSSEEEREGVEWARDVVNLP